MFLIIYFFFDKVFNNIYIYIYYFNFHYVLIYVKDVHLIDKITKDMLFGLRNPE